MLFWGFGEFGLEGWGNEPVVEGLAGGLEFFEIGVLGADLFAEGFDGFVEFGFGEGSDDRLGATGFCGPDDPEFVVDDEVLDQDGIGIGD